MYVLYQHDDIINYSSTQLQLYCQISQREKNWESIAALRLIPYIHHAVAVDTDSVYSRAAVHVGVDREASGLI